MVNTNTLTAVTPQLVSKNKRRKRQNAPLVSSDQSSKAQPSQPDKKHEKRMLGEAINFTRLFSSETQKFYLGKFIYSLQRILNNAFIGGVEMPSDIPSQLFKKKINSYMTELL